MLFAGNYFYQADTLPRISICHHCKAKKNIYPGSIRYEKAEEVGDIIQRSSDKLLFTQAQGKIKAFGSLQNSIKEKGGAAGIDPTVIFTE